MLYTNPINFRSLPIAHLLPKDHQSPTLWLDSKQFSVKEGELFKEAHPRPTPCHPSTSCKSDANAWPYPTTIQPNLAALQKPCCQYILLPSFNPKVQAELWEGYLKPYQEREKKRSECHSVWLLKEKCYKFYMLNISKNKQEVTGKG